MYCIGGVQRITKKNMVFNMSIISTFEIFPSFFYLFFSIVPTIFLLVCPALATEYQVNDPVAGGKVNVRSGPGLDHGVIATLPAGTPGLEVSGCQAPDDNGRSTKPWCHVEWSGHAGWTSSCCISPTSEKVGDGSPINDVSQAEVGANDIRTNSDTGDLRPTVSQALDFVSVGVGCDPKEKVFNEPPPFQHMRHTVRTHNSFNGSSEVWALSSDIWEHSINLSYRTADEIEKNSFDLSRLMRSEARFQDLNERAESNSNTVTISCRRTNCIDLHKKFDNKMIGSIGGFYKDGSWKVSSQTYEFCTPEMAQRIAKAIKFLIEANGGKPSPF